MTNYRVITLSVLLVGAIGFGVVQPADAKRTSTYRKHTTKAKKRQKLIVLNHDDLPRNGRHFYFVPPEAPSPVELQTSKSTVAVMNQAPATATLAQK